MQPASTDSHAQSDLAGAFGYRYEQDIHDAYAAHEKGNRRHGGEQKRHDPAAALRGLDALAQVAHVEVVYGARLDAMAANERVGRLTNGGLYQGLTYRLHVDLICKTRHSRL